MSANFPSSILFKKFNVQCLALDSIINTLPGDYPSAVSRFAELENIADSKGDIQLKYGFKLYQYIYTLTHREADTALEKNIQEFVKEVDEKQFKYLKTEGVELLAEYYWKQKNFAAALEHYINAYEYYSGLSLKEFPHKAEFLCQLGGKYFYFRDFKTAKKYFLEACQNIPEEMLNNNISKLNTLALCYGNQEEYDSATFYFHKAEECALKNHNELWVGIISGNLGNIYIKQNKLDKAVPLLKKNIELSRKHNAMDDLVFSLSEYGAVLLLQHELKKDMELQLEVLEIVKMKNMYRNYAVISRVYPNVAAAYAANGNWTLAYAYLDSAVDAKEIVDKEKNLVFLSGVHHKIDMEKHVAELQNKEAELKHQKIYRNSLLLGLAMLLLLVFFILKNLSNQKKSNIEITSEKQKSELLLLNILPQEVADELKETGESKAKLYNHVTVLFTDFVGFTRISEKLTPEELVAEIHHCFTAFDEIIERHGLEKIKTIGDAYLAVCGMPMEEERHAQKTIEAAIEIISFISKREIEGGHFKMRIGINSGPVVAGIVGVKKFAYDIWGDTVNTAARMEQNSENGKINISGSTYELIKNDFKCLYRGKIQAKNKGEVDMYFVNT